MLAPGVMVTKVACYNPEYYKPPSPSALRNNSQLAHCHWFPWRGPSGLGIWFIPCYSPCCLLVENVVFSGYVVCVDMEAEPVTLVSLLECCTGLRRKKKTIVSIPSRIGLMQEIKCLQKLLERWRSRNQRTAPGLQVSGPTTVATRRQPGKPCWACPWCPGLVGGVWPLLLTSVSACLALFQL